VVTRMAWQRTTANEGAGKPIYWMDRSRLAIVRFLEKLTFEPYPDERAGAPRPGE